MTMAKTMPRQPGKRRQGRVGKGDVNLGRQSAKAHRFVSFLVDITPICRIHSGAEPPRHWFCSIGPLAKKTNFHNHGTGLAYHHNYEPVRAKSLMPDNAGRFGSCA